MVVNKGHDLNINLEQTNLQHSNDFEKILGKIFTYRRKVVIQ